MAIVDMNTILDSPMKLPVKVKEFGASTGLWLSEHLDQARRFDFPVISNPGKKTSPEPTACQGLDAPSTGGFKAGVVESNSAKTGLENATRKGRSINSRFRFMGKDSDGDDRVIEFHVVAYPGMEMKVIVTQLIVNSNDD
ncbi:polyketide synthase [Fusarium tjaetaba]|uniref:Polyketide synthase n=1 Tax=Fusarium tjaetaba TaxID=1567544 RepID=A0A8H5S9K5_9HYPO|nr:polyketide synthase [Fusarium tjaetaba]KAF5647653.1 polyketide synthase [Fusarium tjaetaba]